MRQTEARASRISFRREDRGRRLRDGGPGSKTIQWPGKGIPGRHAAAITLFPFPEREVQEIARTRTGCSFRDEHGQMVED